MKEYSGKEQKQLMGKECGTSCQCPSTSLVKLPVLGVFKQHEAGWEQLCTDDSHPLGEFILEYIQGRNHQQTLQHIT